MSLINFTIPNLTNGVSQQPITIRLPNQGEEQINANCRVTDGLSKRQPVEYLFSDVFKDGDDNIVTLTDDDVKLHMMKGKNTAGVSIVIQLLVQCSTGNLWATYLEGPNQNMNYFQGQYDYLMGGTKQDIKFLTNGDTTYILNRTKTVETLGLSNSDVETNLQGTLVYVQQGYFGTKYQVTVKTIDTTTNLPVQTVTAEYSTADSTGSDISTLQTNNIATALKAALETALTTAGGDINTKTTRVLSKNWFQVKINDNTFAATHRIEIEAFSSTSRQAIYAFNGNVIDYLTLPPTAPEGYVVRVQSDASTTKDDYYLKYAGKDSGWLESKKLGLNDYLDNSTMPLAVKNLITGSTTGDIASIPIKAREVGDLETCPEPSFVNNKLNDMFIFSNRLGFLSKNNVIMSKIDEYDVFYRTTVGTSLSADRVDLQAAVPTARYSELNHAIPFDNQLTMFGESAQYALSANTGFDVKTASLATLTEYESSKDVAPINIGASIYFPVIRGNYTGIFDLSKRDNVGLTAEEVTQHVPVYINGTIIEMVHSTTENMVFCRTAQEKRTVYVQNRFIRQGVMEQNAWHKWVLPNDILFIYVLGSKLYVTMVSDNGEIVTRTSIDISLTLLKQTDEVEITFTPYMDLIKKLSVGSVVETGTDWLGADYYINPELVDQIIAVDIKGSIIKGLTAINNKLVTTELWVGIPFKFTYTFSQQCPAQYGQGGSKTVMQYAKLTLQSMKIAYISTGKFDVKIEPTGRQTHYSYFTGNILGLANSILGRINIYSGVFKFPINSRADAVKVSIESSYPYPVTLNTVEYQGRFVNSGGRM